MKSGVYALHNAFYRLKYPDATYVKYGHSRDIANRYVSEDSSRLPEDSHLNDIKAVIYSPTYSVGGTRILESLVHSFYAPHRVTPKREYFRWDDPSFETGPDVIDFLASKNINDAQIYRRLEDVPDTILDDEFTQNSREVSQLDMIGVAKCRSFQTKIVQDTIQHLRTNDKGCIFLPPGYGKTYIAGFVLQGSPDLRKILVFTPQIMICDEFRKMFQHLGRPNVYTTSDYSSAILASILSGKSDYVLLATYQAFCANPDQFQAFDLIIYDEAHHLVTGQEFQKSLSIVGKKLFLTATPKIQHFDDRSDELLTYSMDNEELYGKAIVSISLQDGIDCGILCDYRILIYKEETEPNDDVKESKSDSMDIENTDENDDQSESDDDQDEKIRDILDCTNHIKMLTCTYGRKKILVFYNTCQEAKTACDSLQLGSVDKFYIDGTMSRDERLKIFEGFSNPSRSCVLFNVNTVSEGVSLPCVDCVLLMASRSSQIVLTQIVGRALRTFPGKSDSIICIPERSMDTMQILLESVWAETKPVRNQVSLASKILLENVNVVQKPSIVQVINNKIKLFQIEKLGGAWAYKFQLCVRYEIENPEKFIQHRTKFSGYNIGVWIQSQESAIRKTQLMLKLLDGHNLDDDEKNFMKNNGSRELTSDQINQFNTLRTVRERGRDKWGDMYNLCVIYEKKNPDKLIQQTIVFGDDDRRIGAWLRRQERVLRKTQILQSDRDLNAEEKRFVKSAHGSVFTYDQINQLKSLRTVKAHGRDQWGDMYKLCVQYELENPQKLITYKTVFGSDNYRIGDWLQRQRQVLKKTQLLRSGRDLNEKEKKFIKHVHSELTSDQIQQFNSLRTVRNHGRDKWSDKYTLCVRYEEENPDKFITCKTIFGDYRIGEWLQHQGRVIRLAQRLRAGLDLNEKEKKLVKCARFSELTSDQIHRLETLRTAQSRKWFDVYPKSDNDIPVSKKRRLEAL